MSWANCTLNDANFFFCCGSSERVPGGFYWRQDWRPGFVIFVMFFVLYLISALSIPRWGDCWLCGRMWWRLLSVSLS